MKDLHYPLAVRERISKSLVHLALHPAKNDQGTLSCHTVRIDLFAEILENGSGNKKPHRLPTHEKLPFFVTNYLEKGPDDDYHDMCVIDGSTALHQAIGYSGYNRINILELLLEKGIDMNTRDIMGNTALHLVINSSGSLIEPISKLLLEYDIDADVQNKRGQTALHIASARGHEAIVRQLLDRRTKVDVQDNSGKTALHLATMCGIKPIVEMLLKSRANINVQDAKGLTALHIACKLEDRVGMTRLLLENGADVGIQDNHGRTALHIVIRTKDQARVELLLENDANSEISDRNGNTPRALDKYYHFETLLLEIELQKKRDLIP